MLDLRPITPDGFIGKDPRPGFNPSVQSGDEDRDQSQFSGHDDVSRSPTTLSAGARAFAVDRRQEVLCA